MELACILLPVFASFRLQEIQNRHHSRFGRLCGVLLDYTHYINMARQHQTLANQRSGSPAHDTYSGCRSRSPRPHDPHSHHKRRRSSPPIPPMLPFRAPQLSKHELQVYKSLFTSYLDIQKQLRYQDLPEDEIRGRWKSFVGKWYKDTKP